MSRFLSAVVALSLVAFAGSAHATAPTKAAIARRLSTLKAQRVKVEARAKADVEAGTFRDADVFAGKSTKDAVDTRVKQLMGRTTRREIKALEDADALLDAGRPDAAAEVLSTWSQNRRATVERETVRRLASRVQRRTGLGRDSQFRPGTPATDDGTRQYFEGGKALSPAQVYSGPWSAKVDKLALPRPGVVLDIVSTRDDDADGMHPSVTGRDPETGLELKVKLGDGVDVSSAAIVSRLVAAMGFRAPQAAYFMPRLDVSPEMVVAAFRHQNKIGVRVKEGGVLDALGVEPGKHGHTWFKMDPRQLAGVTMRAGGTLTGDAAIAQLERAMKDPAEMRAITHVTLRNVTVETEENAGHAIGPLDLNSKDVRDRRAVRAFSIPAAWLDAGDVRLSNGQLVVEKQKGKGGKPDTLKLRKIFSDSGSALSFKDPAAFPATVAVNPRGKRLTDTARTINRAFDRTQPEDAEWVMTPDEERGFARLTTPQIEAAVAAGVDSYPLHRFYVSRLVSRRNAIVSGLGLEATYGLLPEVDLTDVRGGGTIELAKQSGKTRTVTMPEGGFRVEAGELVRVP